MADRIRHCLGAVVIGMIMVVLSGCSLLPSDRVVGTGQERAQAKRAVVMEEERTDAAKRPITIGFSQLGSESDWRIANTASILEAADEAGIHLIAENAEQSQEKQFEAIRSFIRQRVDIIAIAPVVEKGWEPVLQEAKQAGIPVIIVDRQADVSDPSLYVSWIGSDFYEEGRKAGKFVVDKLKNVQGSIEIAELKGTSGSAPSIGRGEGFREILKDHAELAITQSANADFTFEQGKEAMRSFLQNKGNRIRVLFSHNDDMALGAMEAIEEYGLQPGKDIIIVSVDGTSRALNRLREGKINLVVECNPLLGPNLMQAAEEIMRGRSLPKRIMTPETVFTESMVQGVLQQRAY